jgi:defect-in-organelle-trafficking protein DotD
MTKKIVYILLAASVLIGCTTYKKSPVNNPSDDASIKLAEAADSVSDSMQQMARVTKVIRPATKNNALTIPNAYNLQAKASVDWSGPIAELTERVGKAANYNIRVLGKAPAVPILISLDVKDESLADILRNIDYQAGKKANIYVYPNRQVIELRYAKIYS